MFVCLQLFGVCVFSAIVVDCLESGKSKSPRWLIVCWVWWWNCHGLSHWCDGSCHHEWDLLWSNAWVTHPMADTTLEVTSSFSSFVSCVYIKSHNWSTQQQLCRQQIVVETSRHVPGRWCTRFLQITFCLQLMDASCFRLYLVTY